MKIIQHHQSTSPQGPPIAGLRQLLQSLETPGRPCAGCRITCHACQSCRCTCQCSPQCPNAPAYLSSEPGRYPIEQGIVPLVFVMSQIGVQTCWSCEGHLQPDGQLLRVPQVWFYASTMLYPKLLTQYLSTLAVQHVLHYPWQVSLVELGQPQHDLTATFAMKPDLTYENATQLTRLQQDISVIAENMRDALFHDARAMLPQHGEA